ncbi:MAG: heat-inducible transcriptional repressor HrcA [Gammaproteobacteria bacterium]|nr:heat-inducible transcriptional repressor HrcA [Gammaproteobacteria bacterium]
MDNQLDARTQHLFRVLVQNYINDGQPVGSRTLARVSDLDVSPATVRNIMSDLEVLGYLHSPHTSAGRIPTAQGYRLFVDTLIEVKPLNSSVVTGLKSQLIDTSVNQQSVVETASSLLSSLTQMAGVVTMPQYDKAAFRQIEFLSLSDRRILAILVVDQKEVHNRIIHLDRDYSSSELREAANYLNDILAGRSLQEVRKLLLKELDSVRQDMDNLMRTAITLGEKIFAEEEESSSAQNYFVDGQTNLMEFEELSNVGKLRGLFEAFSQKKEILHLLDRCICAEGVQIFIGSESGYDVFDDCSVVSAPYSINEDVKGVLAVVGPTRMAYDRVIPIVDVTAKLLSEALNSE